ncbi:MAG: DUF1592 domain-containing protein [Acidobacteria bacterium]|nr:DUF1592 domain-containing protein [Acidobacteriota bacterium]
MRAWALASLLTLPVAAAPPASLPGQLNTTIRPFLQKHCVGCHSGKTPAAQFDLTAYTTLGSVTHEFPRWALVMERLRARDMPPKPLPSPPAADTDRVISWIEQVRAAEIKRSAGDPGLVPARRLSNAEYNYTIRDLTGQNLDVTREFPIDPANPAGFDNSGESLTMSPALLNKYLQAARDISTHMVLAPGTIQFSPHPMMVETDREKYAIQQIISFYFRQPTQHTAYFAAAWRYQHRAAFGLPRATLESIAAEAGLSRRYLPQVWQILNEPDALGPVAKLQAMWKALPAPGQPEQLTAGCRAMDAFVTKLRAHTGMQYAAPKVRGLPAGSQPLLNWKLKQFATHRRDSDPAALRNDTDPPPDVPAIPRYAGLHQEAAPRWAALMARDRAGDPDLVVPAAQRERYQAAFARFASVFPDKFYITERGRYFPDDSEDKGRLLSAGYHSVLGFYRDDQPLMELILDDEGRRELDRLWNEFDYIADFTARTWIQYFFNQSGEVQGKGAESASERPVGRGITDAGVISDMRDAYLKKAAADPGNDPIAPQAIREHYDGINATLRALEQQRKTAEPKHLDALLAFAARAYRRPLDPSERQDLTAYYRTLRSKNELTHEAALRECLVSILMAPDFLYRLDLSSSMRPQAAPVRAPKAGQPPAHRPLSNDALASRLSYFLWASMPDQELLRHVTAGDLQRPEVLLAQARRMLKDQRIRGLATEFTGNWLGFRQFETNNSVDRARFPAFNNELRSAMFQEPVRLLGDAFANDRSLLDLLYGRHTFVNPALAKHYGIPGVTGPADQWVRIEDARPYGRGGLLPMAVFLTQNSPGLRTSPVKRGNWVVQRVLGEVVPPPPPAVPELPNDESTSELPVRDMLTKHRENALCAACHARIDSFGLAFEGYGPVGDVRTKDLAGRAVETQVSYPGGLTGSGVEGLQRFIRERREKDFVLNISRKLLAFALNRSLQLSDEALVERMAAQAQANGCRLSALVEAIVTSQQFRHRRLPETPAATD